MPAIEKKVQTYADWSGGNWGAKGGVVAATESPFNYRAINLQVYANGSIGPRPGWKLLSTTGTAPTSANTTDYWGAIWLPSPNASSGKLLFVSRSTGASTRLLNMSTLAWEATFLGALSAVTVEGPVETNPGDFTYLNPQQLIVGANHIYNIESGADIAMSYPSSFAPTQTVFYKERLYAFGDATFQNRVYYSDYGAFSTFTAGNYFDVGSGGSAAETRPRIRAAWVIKDQLMFLTTTGTISQIDPFVEIFALQGANAITGSLVRIAQGRGPLYPSTATVHRELVITLDHLQSRGAILLSPGGGIETDALSYIRPGNDIYQFSAGRNGVSNYGEDSVFLPYIAKGTVDPSGSGAVRNVSEVGMQAWALVHGVWTKEVWWEGAIAEAVDAATKTNLLYATLSFQGNKMIAITNAGAAGPNAGTWRVFTRDICLDRPSRTGDTWSDATEPHSDLAGTPFGVDAQLWLPEEMAPLGTAVRVRKVTVEFDYWKHADYSPASTADFSVMVKYRGQKGGTQVDSVTQGGADDSFDYLTATTGFYPERGRRTFTFETSPWYGSYQVVFPTMRNVAFRKVTVEYEQNPAEMGA